MSQYRPGGVKGWCGSGKQAVRKNGCSGCRADARSASWASSTTYDVGQSSSGRRVRRIGLPQERVLLIVTAVVPYSQARLAKLRARGPAGGGEPIDVRRAHDPIACAAQMVRAMLVCQDDQKVGAAGTGICYCHASKCCSSQFIPAVTVRPITASRNKIAMTPLVLKVDWR